MCKTKKNAFVFRREPRWSDRFVSIFRWEKTVEFKLEQVESTIYNLISCGGRVYYYTLGKKAHVPTDSLIQLGLLQSNARISCASKEGVVNLGTKNVFLKNIWEVRHWFRCLIKSRRSENAVSAAGNCCNFRTNKQQARGTAILVISNAPPNHCINENRDGCTLNNDADYSLSRQ